VAELVAREKTDGWGEHFRLDPRNEITIIPVTDVGEVTARIFGFNQEERLLERAELLAVGRYPSAAALRRARR
jgi:hypothetical protein